MPETEIIFSVQESPEGGYEARAPSAMTSSPKPRARKNFEKWSGMLYGAILKRAQFQR
jgi:hypothetical protein